MKIIIETPDANEEDSITIRVHQLHPSILKFVSNVRMEQEALHVLYHNEIHRIALCDIYYFEAVDNKTFLYTGHQVYEIKQKLYQLEEMYATSTFARISKSMIVNLTKITKIIPSISGRFIAIMENEEKLSISRQYVGNVKQKISQ